MIVNFSKGTELCSSFESCDSVFQQLRGMMFRKNVVPLLFSFPKEQFVRLHSWFCPGLIDLVLLDEQWVVVELLSDWPKRSGFHSKRKCMFVLELPPGTIAKSGTEVGDVVQIKF